MTLVIETQPRDGGPAGSGHVSKLALAHRKHDLPPFCPLPVRLKLAEARSVLVGRDAEIWSRHRTRSTGWGGAPPRKFTSLIPVKLRGDSDLARGDNPKLFVGRKPDGRGGRSVTPPSQSSGHFLTTE